MNEAAGWGREILCSAQYAVTLECEAFQCSYNLQCSWLVCADFCIKLFSGQFLNSKAEISTQNSLLLKGFLFVGNRTKYTLPTVSYMCQHLGVLIVFYIVKYTQAYEPDKTSQ